VKCKLSKYKIYRAFSQNIGQYRILFKNIGFIGQEELSSLTLTLPCAGGTTAYRGASSGWPMEEALYEVTLKGCAE